MSKRLIPVGSGFVRSVFLDANVFGLFVGQYGQFGAELVQVEAGNLFVQVLGENVHLVFVFLGVFLFPQFKLGNNLISETARHDETGVTGGATKIQQTAFSKDNDTVTIGPDEAVNLRFDVLSGDSFVVQDTSHIDFVIEVTNVTNDGVVFHSAHLISGDDTLVTGGGDENINITNDIFEANNLETFHASLESADRVNFSNQGTSTGILHRLGGTFSDITITADEDSFTSKHNIGGTHDTIGERVTATVDVVEFGFGDRVVDVDSGEQQSASLCHLVQSVDTGGGFFRDTNAFGGEGSPFVRVDLEHVSDELEDDFEFRIVGRFRVGHGAIFLECSFGFHTFVDEEGSITAIIDNDVGTGAVGPVQGLVCAPPVLLKSLTLPGKDVGSPFGDDGGGSVVLGREDVARAPTNGGTQSLESFDKDGSLDGHVE